MVSSFRHPAVLLGIFVLIGLACAEPPEDGCPRGYVLNSNSGNCDPKPWYDPYPQQCPYGTELVGGHCVPQYSSNWPQPSPLTTKCPDGYKLSRGVCSQMSERERYLDSNPQPPCPPGQRKSRLVCRDYYGNK